MDDEFYFGDLDKDIVIGDKFNKENIVMGKCYYKILIL